jgi:hypothetical protein
MVEKIIITSFLLSPMKDLILNALTLYGDKNIDYRAFQPLEGPCRIWVIINLSFCRYSGNNAYIR